MAQKKVDQLEERLVLLQEGWQQEFDSIKGQIQKGSPVVEQRFNAMEKAIETILAKVTSLEKQKENGSTVVDPGDQWGTRGETSQTRNGEITTRYENRTVKQLDFPMFDGNDPDGWVFRVERYFSIHRRTETERLEAVAIAMEGKALSWFQFAEEEHRFESWKQFKEMVLMRFRSKQEGNLYERFLAIYQQNTVEENIENFEVLATPLQERLPREVLKGTFLNGLKPALRAEVIVLNPNGLTAIMDMAQRLEEKNRVILGRAGLRSNGGTGWVQSNLGPQTKKHLDSYANSSNSSKQSVTFSLRNNTPITLPNSNSYQEVMHGQQPSKMRRLTEAEEQRRRKEGLCFRCEEKYSPGHRCKNRFLQLMVCDEENQEEEEIEERGDYTDHTEEVEGQIELSMNSVVGISSPKTMKLRGTIEESLVVVLIDCGATHNFISQELVLKLEIPLTHTATYGVIIGTGNSVKTAGICKGVSLILPEVKIVEDFLPTKLGSADVILGMQWLEKLGATQVNWRDLLMKCVIDGNEVVIKGENELCSMHVSLKTQMKEVANNREGLILEGCEMGIEEQKDQGCVISSEVQDVLGKFAFLALWCWVSLLVLLVFT